MDVCGQRHQYWRPALLVTEDGCQANGLFSYDRHRYLVSMAWIADVVDATNPSSLVDMDAVGLLLKFFNEHHNHIQLHGIDAAENFVQIGSELNKQELLAGDYLTHEPTSKCDLVICEFGYDDAKIGVSKPHSTPNAGLRHIAQGVRRRTSFFIEYMEAWRKWSQPKGCLALIGRTKDYTTTRAVILAAQEVGWFVNLKLSKMLTAVDPLAGGPESFTALYFTSQEAQAATQEEIATFYSQ